MQKNNKNGFFFFDLLVSLMIIMTFITIIFFTVSLLMYHYTVNKQFLLAENIMSQVLYSIEKGDYVSSSKNIKNQNFDFTITIETENVPHTPLFNVTNMSLFLVTVSWFDPREKEQSITFKTLKTRIP